ncbi:hypothetical protein Btru_001260 [Bulinus truncatus]|nr:hypothetical protein Btru_001260 [Bulinus truncatus]
MSEELEDVPRTTREEIGGSGQELTSPGSCLAGRRTLSFTAPITPRGIESRTLEKLSRDLSHGDHDRNKNKNKKVMKCTWSLFLTWLYMTDFQFTGTNVTNDRLLVYRSLQGQTGPSIIRPKIRQNITQKLFHPKKKQLMIT